VGEFRGVKALADLVVVTEGGHFHAVLWEGEKEGGRERGVGEKHFFGKKGDMDVRTTSWASWTR